MLHQKNEYSFFFQSVRFQTISFESTDITMFCLSHLLWFPMTHFRNTLHLLFSFPCLSKMEHRLFFSIFSGIASFQFRNALQLSLICHLISLLSVIPVTISFIYSPTCLVMLRTSSFIVTFSPFNNPSGLKHTCFITTNSITFSSVSLKC